jgi:RNA polymerase sigma-70 factor (ECF subfamily)
MHFKSEVGGMEGFMELYQTVYKDMYRLAYYYMGSAEDAEDAVQEAAMAAYEHFCRLKDKDAFRPWIFKILVNRCKKSLKKRSRRELVKETVERSYEPSLSSQAEVLELLGKLDDEERLIVTLTVYGGYKGEEIARILNKNHSTVRSKYRRALKKLESELT